MSRFKDKDKKISLDDRLPKKGEEIFLHIYRYFIAFQKTDVLLFPFPTASSTDAAKDSRKGKKSSMAKVDRKGIGGGADQDVR